MTIPMNYNNMGFMNERISNVPANEHKDTPAKVEVDPTDLAAVKAMTWGKLVETMANMPPGASCLPIGRELLDRMEGRPVQRTDARVLTKSEGEIIIKLVD